MNPLERLETPEDNAASIAFHTGSDGGWINVQTFWANGGMVHGAGHALVVRASSFLPVAWRFLTCSLGRTVQLIRLDPIFRIGRHDNHLKRIVGVLA